MIKTFTHYAVKPLVVIALTPFIMAGFVVGSMWLGIQVGIHSIQELAYWSVSKR